MARTFLDLQNEALHDDFDPLKYRALVKTWINEALHKIARRSDMVELHGLYQLPLVVGTASYAWPADCVRIVSVFDATTPDREPLDEVSQLDVDMLDDTSAQPWAFAVDEVVGRAVVLYPTPDRSTYRLYMRYLRNATDLSADTDTVTASMPDDYVDLLVTYARSRLYEREDDDSFATSLMAKFEAALGQMRSDVQAPSRRRKHTGGMFRSGGGTPAFRRS